MNRVPKSDPNRDVKGSVERQFSQVAANYSTSTVHAQGVDLLRMVEVAGLQGDEVVLDAGCGAGHTALAFAPHVARVVAMDLSESMLEQVQQLASQRDLTNIEVRRGDVENLPFEDERFDIVTSRYSAHHWPNPQRALREFHRVLHKQPRRRGQLLLGDVASSDQFIVDTFIQAIELLRDPSHVRDHTLAQWLAMFSGAGFDGELVFEWDLWLQFQSWVARMATPPEIVDVIEGMLTGAPQEVRTALKVEDDLSFTFKGILLRGCCSG